MVIRAHLGVDGAEQAADGVADLVFLAGPEVAVQVLSAESKRTPLR